MDPAVERFRAETSPFVSDWKSINLKIIATKSLDKWMYGAIRVVLDSGDPVPIIRKELPNVENLLVAHEQWSIGRLDELLEMLSAGELKVQERTIVVDNPNQSPKMNYTFQRMSRQDALQRLAVGSYSLYLQSWAGNRIIEKDSEVIESLLRSGDYPWDGLIDLLRNFLNISPNFVSTMPTRLVEVIAPVVVNIEHASLVEDKVQIRAMVAPSIDKDQVALSVIAHLDDGSQIRLRELKKSMVDSTHFSIQVVLPQKPIMVVAVLTYHNLDVDRVELFGEPKLGINPRLAVLNEDRLESFIASLRQEKDKLFEDKVSILFHVLGFSPGHYGRIKQDNPDILVFPDSDDWLLDVECTEQNLDVNGKISKLATRTKLLVAAMPEVSIYPVLVTKFPRYLINATDSEKAAKEKVSIVTSDDFERLLQLAIEGAPQNKVRDYILGLVPGVYGTRGLGIVT